jgi:hypothetical protein
MRESLVRLLEGKLDQG